MEALPQVTLQYVWAYMRRNPKLVFVFVDKKGAIFYYRPWRSVVYVSGNFTGETELEVREELRAAVTAMLN